MAREWTDAEFEVVEAPLRRGDPHPTRKGWRCVAADPASGMSWWYVPPRLSRLRLFLMACVAVPLVWLALSYGAEFLDHHWPR